MIALNVTWNLSLPILSPQLSLPLQASTILCPTLIGCQNLCRLVELSYRQVRENGRDQTLLRISLTTLTSSIKHFKEWL